MIYVMSSRGRSCDIVGERNVVGQVPWKFEIVPSDGCLKECVELDVPSFMHFRCNDVGKFAFPTGRLPQVTIRHTLP